MTFRERFRCGSRALGLAILGLLLAGIGRADAEPILALTTGNRLLTFDNLTPGTITNAATISGISAGQSLVGIDLRPRNGLVYGVARSTGGAASLYTLDATTGAASLVANLVANPLDTTNPFTSLPGTDFGIDFNPVPDTTDAATGSLRLVDSLGNNYRINANNGQVFTDTSLSYLTTTGSVRTPQIVSVAYSNNVFGATTTTLRGVDSAAPDILATFMSPNDGTLLLDTAILLPFNTNELAGYDISGVGGIYFSSTAPGASSSDFIQFVGGNFINRGLIGGGETIRDITALTVPEPASLALLGVGAVVGLVTIARRKRAAAPTV